jgi:heparan-alpha-glucosaminide N-acetyltransferase
MVGMAVPFSIGNRIAKGENNTLISRHIIIRTLSLLIIGVLMSNSRNVSLVNTGISKSLWSFIMYSGVFLIWNNYKITDKNFYFISALKVVGLLMILVMVYIFRSDNPENNTFSLRGWGILGTIGWGYLAAAFLYLGVRNNILKTTVALLLFLSLNVLSKLHFLDFMSPVKAIFGVLINGNAPFIVISGLLITLILKKFSNENSNKTALTILSLGILSILAGFIFRKWFIISKIQSTPSWGLICNGISMILFALLYWIIDIKKQIKWASFLRPAGENSLTIYLVPDMFYYIIWGFNLPLLFYKNSALPPIVVVSGSILWALIMGVGLSYLLARLKFKLRL